MKSRAKLEPVSGKHRVCTHFPKDPNCVICVICLKTKTTRASCRRPAGTVVPRAEHFGDLITADQKTFSVEKVNRVTIIDMPWYKDFTPMQNKDFPGDPWEPDEVPRADKEAKSHSHWQFLGTWQGLWGIILESLSRCSCLDLHVAGCSRSVISKRGSTSSCEGNATAHCQQRLFWPRLSVSASSPAHSDRHQWKKGRTCRGFGSFGRTFIRSSRSRGCTSGTWEWRDASGVDRWETSPLDIATLNSADNRRLEVVADGLPLFHGAQLAIDITMVSPLSCTGVPLARCADIDGAATMAARRRKQRRCPELAGEGGRARLVVLACEVGGRFSEECRHFLRQLSKFKARDEPPLLQQRVRHAWLHRWGSMMACSGARAMALSLLEQRRRAWRGWTSEPWRALGGTLHHLSAAHLGLCVCHEFSAAVTFDPSWLFLLLCPH